MAFFLAAFTLAIIFRFGYFNLADIADSADLSLIRTGTEP